MIKYVAYYRVSTAKQGRSGLGLEAQKHTVKQFIGENELVAEFTEIESGKNNHRVELQKAIDFANNHKAKLLIARLDRLSRSIEFTFKLRDSQVDFICCDIPDANTLTIGLMAVMNQYTRELISENTKKGLAEKKRQGFSLGKPENLTDAARQKGRYVSQQKALNDTSNRRATALITLLRGQNKSFQDIATELNNNGFRSRKGRVFYAMTVKRLYERSLNYQEQ
jgi:DNA invertase Pin-like site-specific DNA recombinase